MSMLRGRAWVFGDDIDTDQLAPGAYLKMDVDTMAQHCLEVIDPRFAGDVAAGDIVVAGHNFGLGSSREQAAECLKILGIAAVVARSFARIFYRNALNLGLPALVVGAAPPVAAGDILEVDPVQGRVTNISSRAQFTCRPIPQDLMEMVRDGGLIAHLKKRFSQARPA